ncbi:16S rRNA (guanine(966)-N(2))-methyltransferase RsmD [Ligilactobacillus murinus]|jgi:RNA methyltransferase, RsmD family|uniref:16S rRNA (Guanine(966)-N(2))-methyltransferase RsmD n=2 Tax=Ligilactobacillus murinus TaxID=1622 RepID=A0A2Z4VZ04_9LACO|nr:16S rRNA (guanine(966)-N(2))-methyltransferase RsmD [Ligilactobacillus murinus]NBH83803.1 16S rRNA (guanine(966)-N(2))-methyltransferase RsmD [Lachnospiraceae bacterium]HAB50495.1 16S rRNA (guanine(966)-N(2))-methyltransferase RsmD [Lactobacillus sp.]AWZ38288.1 16S rRNA (guanine(966)-N(2))-methyltransferase RsmD [Ligilactobacillus murinus]AWZ40725.1 16S rRNA (guanine(966)-N(2))-methyltransferase RsmD [Ligilactobacillus murinus]MBF0701587.1 16S rRNA (guanine(966)-N(2))-methyltransferase RsmD
MSCVIASVTIDNKRELNYMRVVAGEYGGRRLKAVPGMKTRPTTDKVKEAMFNIIGPYLEGGQVLDLFAGSGGLSIEAVSRGADHATLVDRQYQAIKTIHENLSVTKEEDKFTVLKGDAYKMLNKLAKQEQGFDYVFLDPPYKKQQILELMEQLKKLGLLNTDALIICETDQVADLPEELADFELIKKADYGITELTFYRYKEVN